MKRWAALTVLVYLAALAVLAVPLLMLFLGPWPIATPGAAYISRSGASVSEPGILIWLAFDGSGAGGFALRAGWQGAGATESTTRVALPGYHRWASVWRTCCFAECSVSA